MTDLNAKALEHMKKGEVEEAVKVLTEQIEKVPTDVVAYINFGNVLLSMGDVERAARFYDRAIEIDSNVPTVYYSYGNLYYQAQEYTKAAQKFQMALEKGLDEADVYFMLGISLLNQGEAKLAMPYLLTATEKNPDDIEAWFQYALVLAQLSLFDEAINAFNQVLAMDDTHADALYYLGTARLMNGEDSTIIKPLFEKVVTLQPEHEMALSALDAITAYEK